MQHTSSQYAARSTACKTNVTMLNTNTKVLYYCCDPQQIIQVIVTENATYISFVPKNNQNNKYISVKNITTIYSEYPPFYVHIEMLRNSNQFNNTHQRVFLINIISLDAIQDVLLTFTCLKHDHAWQQAQNIQQPIRHQGIPLNIPQLNPQISNINQTGINQNVQTPLCSLEDIFNGQCDVKCELRYKNTYGYEKQHKFPILAQSITNEQKSLYVIYYTAEQIQVERCTYGSDYKDAQFKPWASSSNINVFPHFCLCMTNKIISKQQEDKSPNKYETVESEVQIATYANLGQNNQDQLRTQNQMQPTYNQANLSKIKFVDQFPKDKNDNDEKLQQLYGYRSEKILFICYSFPGQQKNNDSYDIVLAAYRIGFQIIDISYSQYHSQQINIQNNDSLISKTSVQLFFTQDQIVKMKFCRCQNPSLYVQTKKCLYKYTSSSLLTFLHQKVQQTHGKSQGQMQQQMQAYQLAAEVIQLPPSITQPFFLLNKGKYTFNQIFKTMNFEQQGCQVIFYK